MSLDSNTRVLVGAGVAQQRLEDPLQAKDLVVTGSMAFAGGS